MDVSPPSSFYHWVVSAIALVGFKLTVDKILSIRTAFARIKYVCNIYIVVSRLTSTNRDYPGCVPLWLNPFNAVALVLGTTFPRPGMAGYYAGKFSCMSLSLLHISLQTSRHLVYKRFEATSFASVRVSAAQQFFWLADPEAIKLVVSDRHTFQKDIVSYELLNIYGENVISVEGSKWKRHRSVAMSAFNEASSLSLAPFAIVCLTWVLQGKHCIGLDGNSACDRRMVRTT